jgi:FG-GAP repeat
VSLLLNGGAATFRTTIDVGAYKCGDVDRSDRALALGDLNGDGRADIAVASDTGLCVTLAKPGLCNVQEVRGLKPSQARALLARAHCRVGSVRHAHSLLYRSRRVSVERPGFGRALPAGAKVDLVVSLGRP